MRAAGSRPSHRRNQRPAACLLAGAALAWSLPAAAAARLAVTADSLDHNGLIAHDVALEFEPVAGGRVALRAASVAGPQAPPGLAALRLTCGQLQARGDSVRCRDGRISGAFGEWGAQDSPAELAFAADGSLRITAPELRLGGGRAALDATLTGDRWTADLTLEQVGLAALAALPLLRGTLSDDLTVSAGSLGGQAHASGRGESLDTAHASLILDGVGFADQAGALAAEQLGARLVLDAGSPNRDGTRPVQLEFGADTGQAYVEPVFLDFAANPAQVTLQGSLAGTATVLTVADFRFVQRGVGTVRGTAELDFDAAEPLREARTVLEDLDLDGAVALYARPLLIATPFADLAGAGTVRGEVDVDSGLPSRIQVTLEAAAFDSPRGAVSVEGLTGQLRWFDEELRNELAADLDSDAFHSRLDWQHARLWGIEFGPASVPFTSTGPHFRLLEPTLLPVFDGGLAIETLRVRHAGTPRMYVRFDAELEPISVALIARAFDWPEFSGTLAGRIPRLELADGYVTLGGNIEAQVFDGTVTVRDLRMRDPLGQFPQLYAEVAVDALDLALLTGTFEFGMITGRLSGRVAGLETFDWMPVAFDAALFTTPGDRSRHRISQRAVANLSSIGGGSRGTVTSALQGGFLRFFESFRYDRLGLSCRLVNDICAMDGVAPAPGGYYIVRGAGVPRIDVIGNQKRVAWSRLISQLAAVTQASGPVVQ